MYLGVLFIVAAFVASKGNVIPEKEVVAADSRNNYITYRLYNKNIRGEVYTSADEHLEHMENGIPTIIIIHGEGGSYRDDFSTSLRSRFVDGFEVNVFVMDWEFLAAQDDKIFENLRIAARDLIEFLLHLRNIIGDSNQENGVHMVGFGIGAHLAGNAGFQLSLFWPIARITGLDPTGDQFGPNSLHLAQGHALYVEVIHTDGGIIKNGLTTSEKATTSEELTTTNSLETDINPVFRTTPDHIGIGRRIGDVDFFVNGFDGQPGCDTSVCRHNRAWQLFALSLEYNHFLGFRCISMEEMKLDRCNGLPLLMGGADLAKVPMLPGIYRVNSAIVTNNLEVIEEEFLMMSPKGQHKV